MPNPPKAIRLVALAAISFVLVSSSLAHGASLVESRQEARQELRQSGRQLTNGCAVSARGIPRCGAYAGGAYGGNSDVRPWERSMGRKLGVHRTYWGPTQVESAVATAREDARNKRLPWMSFKAPYSWSEMASGRGDAWAGDLARRMSRVPGPVWVAVHHEPENDSGDIMVWKRMQERLAPIMRKAAPNLGYSVILMGYHQFQGDARYSLARTWPDTKVDVAGFDIYEKYGVTDNGRTDYEWKQFRAKYFVLIKRWARAERVAWGLAETGYSDPAAREHPRWPVRKFRLMKRFDGVAFSYFNTHLHSKANWTLSMGVKHSAFSRVVNKGVRLR